MTPNLTRLFEEKRNQADCDEARDLIADMFDTHGEALIAALEEAPDFGGSPQTAFGYEYREWLAGVRTLLAQLEAEAQP
jgi:hypothetical protein